MGKGPGCVRTPIQLSDYQQRITDEVLTVEDITFKQRVGEVTGKLYTFIADHTINCKDEIVFAPNDHLVISNGINITLDGKFNIKEETNQFNRITNQGTFILSEVGEIEFGDINTDRELAPLGSDPAVYTKIGIGIFNQTKFTQYGNIKFANLNSEGADIFNSRAYSYAVLNYLDSDLDSGSESDRCNNIYIQKGNIDINIINFSYGIKNGGSVTDVQNERGSCFIQQGKLKINEIKNLSLGIVNYWEFTQEGEIIIGNIVGDDSPISDPPITYGNYNLIGKRSVGIWNFYIYNNTKKNANITIGFEENNGIDFGIGIQNVGLTFKQTGKLSINNIKNKGYGIQSVQQYYYGYSNPAKRLNLPDGWNQNEYGYTQDGDISITLLLNSIGIFTGGNNYIQAGNININEINSIGLSEEESKTFGYGLYIRPPGSGYPYANYLYGGYYYYYFRTDLKKIDYKQEGNIVFNNLKGNSTGIGISDWYSLREFQKAGKIPAEIVPLFIEIALPNSEINYEQNGTIKIGENGNGITEQSRFLSLIQLLTENPQQPGYNFSFTYTVQDSGVIKLFKGNSTQSGAGIYILNAAGKVVNNGIISLVTEDDPLNSPYSYLDVTVDPNTSAGFNTGDGTYD